LSAWNPPPSDQPGPSRPGDPYASQYAVPGSFGLPQAPAYDPLISADYAGWWNRGVEIVKRGWRPLVALQAVGLILALVTQVPVGVFAALAERDASLVTDADPAPLFAFAGLGLLGVLAAVVVTSIVTLATVHVGVSVAVGAPVRMGEAINLAARRVFPLIGWTLLAVPIYVAGLCLCVLPILYVAAVFTVLAVVVAVERTNAISRCFSLFHKDLGTAVSRIATVPGITIGVAVVGATIGAVAEVAARSGIADSAGIILGSTLSSLLAAVLSGAAAVLLAPLTLTAYADMRSRQEPLTSARIAQELGIAAPGGQPPYASGGPAYQ
jgi:hypothetical protein